MVPKVVVVYYTIPVNPYQDKKQLLLVPVVPVVYREKMDMIQHLQIYQLFLEVVQVVETRSQHIHLDQVTMI